MSWPSIVYKYEMSIAYLLKSAKKIFMIKQEINSNGVKNISIGGESL